MGLIISLFKVLAISAWPIAIFACYAHYPEIRRVIRFVLQNAFILPVVTISCMISMIPGLMIKYLTVNFIPKSYRTLLLAAITANFLQLLLFLLEFWTNMKYLVSDENVSDEIFYLNSIFMCNHSASPFDWIGLLSLSDFLERSQNGFSFMKRSFAWVPLVGWIGSLQSSISLDRNWNQDKKKIQRLCQSFLSKRDYKWIKPWVFFFYPEGTRMTPQKLLDAQKFAKERGYAVLEHLMQPRVKGFSYLAHHLYEGLGCVIDVTCLYHPSPPQPIDVLVNTRLAKYTHLHLRVFRQHEIPQCRDENDLGALDQWLRDRWAEKDEIMARMKQNRIPFKVLNRTPWRATAVYAVWAVLTNFVLFHVLFPVPSMLFWFLVITTLCPAAIVCIEYPATGRQINPFDLSRYQKKKA